MLTRRPAAAGEPMQEWLGKREGRVRRCLDIHDRRTSRALIGCKLLRHNALIAVESGMMCPIIFTPASSVGVERGELIFHRRNPLPPRPGSEPERPFPCA